MEDIRGASARGQETPGHFLEKQLGVPVSECFELRRRSGEPRDVPAKFAPAWGGSWDTTRCFSNGLTHESHHLVYATAVARAHLKQLKLPELPSVCEAERLLGLPVTMRWLSAQMGQLREPVRVFCDGSVGKRPPDLNPLSY